MLKIKDPGIKIGFRLSLLLLGCQLVFLIFFWNRLPPQGPLFYSRPWGEKQLADLPWSYLFLPGLSLSVLIINLFWASVLTKEIKLAGQLLVIFAALFNLLALTTLLKIVFLVT